MVIRKMPSTSAFHIGPQFEAFVINLFVHGNPLLYQASFTYPMHLDCPQPARRAARVLHPTPPLMPESGTNTRQPAYHDENTTPAIVTIGSHHTTLAKHSDYIVVLEFRFYTRARYLWL